MYLFGYGAGRVWIEGLRTDQLWIPGTEIPVSQVLAGTIVVVSLILIIYNRIKVKKASISLNNKKGFTLVELIVVLTILAILAALIIPSLVGYIDKAKQKSIISEARGVWTAAQAGASEYYGLNANDEAMKKAMKFTVTIDNEQYTNVGRISNSALYDEQMNWHTENPSSSQKIAQEILIYLESKDSKNAQYSFGNAKEPKSGGTLKENMSRNFTGKIPGNAVFIQLFYDKNFKVIGVNFGKDGYLATITEKEITCEKNGRVFSF